MFKEKTLISVEQWLVGLSFFMPLVVLPGSFIFPFIVPKILLFRSLVLIMLGVYGLLLYINWERYRPQMTALNIAIFGFWLSFAVSTFVGVDWYRSFWDNHERMLGLFTVTHYVLFYYILVGVLQEGKQWNTLLRWFLGAGSLVMIIGVLQKIDPELLMNRSATRVASTLGNSIYMSGYGLFLFFFEIISFLESRSHLYWKYFALITAVLGFFGVFLGGTRGTFLGLVAALGVLLISFGIFTSVKKYKVGVVVAGIVGVIALLGAFSFSDSPVVQRITPIARLVNIDYASLSDNTRVMAWGVAWDSFIEKPVFGWGPNNYYYAFNKYYRPEFLFHGFGETWFDNAHNIVMNTLSTQGAFGIVTYLAIFVVAIMILLQARKRGDIENIEFSVLIAFFVGHFVHNIFVFENPTSYLYFFFALAYVAIRVGQVPRSVDRSNTAVSGPALVTTILVVCISVYIFNVNPAKANTATLHAIQSVYRGQGIEEYEVASGIPTPHIDDVRTDFARTASQVVPQLVEAGLSDQALTLVTLSIRETEKNISLHPADIRLYLLLSQLYQQRAIITDDGTYIATSIELLQDGLVYSPKRQQIFFTLANIYMITGNTTTAEQYLREAYEFNPYIAESILQLANYYTMIGNTSTGNMIIEDTLNQDGSLLKKRDISRLKSALK